MTIDLPIERLNPRTWSWFRKPAEDTPAPRPTNEQVHAVVMAALADPDLAVPKFVTPAAIRALGEAGIAVQEHDPARPAPTFPHQENTMATLPVTFPPADPSATNPFAPTQVTSQPAPAPVPAPVTKSHQSFLHFLGSIPKKVFAFLGSQKGQAVIAAGEGLAEEAFPALTGAINLGNAWMVEIVKEETLAAAAGQQDGTGPQKAAGAVLTMGPSALAFAQKHGLTPMTADKLKQANDGLALFLNALGAPAALPNG